MKNDRGEITIMMVITAIILIILGGICIFMLTGENGIFVLKTDSTVNSNQTQETNNSTVNSNEVQGTSNNIVNTNKVQESTNNTTIQNSTQSQNMTNNLDGALTVPLQ